MEVNREDPPRGRRGQVTPRGHGRRLLALFVVAPVLALVLTQVAREPVAGRHPLRVPLTYGGDGLYSAAPPRSG